jgi:hypothetical protein
MFFGFPINGPANFLSASGGACETAARGRCKGAPCGHRVIRKRDIGGPTAYGLADERLSLRHGPWNENTHLGQGHHARGHARGPPNPIHHLLWRVRP